MKIELLLSPDCPNAEPARALLKDCLAALGISTDLTEIQVDTPELAKLMGFPGSPTIRVNEADVAPLPDLVEGSLACRLYEVGGRKHGLPDRAWILERLRKAQESESHACCTPIAATKGSFLCPFSGSTGKAVKPVTLRSLLLPNLRDRVKDQVYRFCGDPTCEVVYFSEDGTQTFLKSDLAVRVGIKETEAPRPLCYCFGHSYESLQKEIEATGSSTAAAAIKAEVKAGTCRCEVTNPGGGCCLGDVTKAVKELQGGSSSKSGPLAPSQGTSGDACAIACELNPKSEPVQAPPDSKRTTWAAVGLGLLASACCWLPLALAGAGVAGGAAGAKVAWLRPWALGGLAIMLLGVVGWWFYQRHRPSLKGDCCEVGRTQFPALPVAVLALSFMGAWAAPRFLDHPVSVTGASAPMGAALLVLSTPQYDCAPCAGTLPDQMAKTPGVASVQMDFNKRETRIAFAPGADQDQILKGWKQNLGFTGTVVQKTP